MSFLRSTLRISEIVSFPVISKFMKKCLSVWLLQKLKKTIFVSLPCHPAVSLRRCSISVDGDRVRLVVLLRGVECRLMESPRPAVTEQTELSVSPLFWVRAITALQQHTRVQGGRKQMHTEKVLNVFTRRTQTVNYVHHCLTSDVVALQISVLSVATMEYPNVEDHEDWTQAHLFFSWDWTIAG